jgi:hypothetical protein
LQRGQLEKKELEEGAGRRSWKKKKKKKKKRKKSY